MNNNNLSFEKTKISKISGTTIPLVGDNIDTDRIIPARFLKEITFDNMDKYLFFDERFDESGKAKNHPFNDKRYVNANILIVNKNFGFGSSREHAAQGIKRFGINAIIGESFSPIFFGNCAKLEIPCIQINSKDIEQMMNVVFENPQTRIEIDFTSAMIRYNDVKIKFFMDKNLLKSFERTMNMTELMRSNSKYVRIIAKKLPYLNKYQM